MIESLRASSLSSYNFGPLSLENKSGSNPQIVGTGELTINSPTANTGYVNYNAAGEVQIRGTTSGDILTLTRYSTSGGPSLNLRRSDTATINAAGTADLGDGLGNIFFEGYDSSVYAAGASIRVFAEENWSTTARGTNLRFYTTPNGSTTITERMRIDAAGLITAGSGSGTSLGAWTTYAPSITAGSGSFTTVSASGRYCQIGKMVFVTANIIITTNGTAASSVIMTLPVNTVAGTSYMGSGRCDAVSGKMVQIKNSSASQVAIFTYDNLYPGASGEIIRVYLQYEAA